MPQHPTAPRPPIRSLDEPTQRLEVETTPAPKAPDLTVNKVLAGAGAAATSAVLGSFFGAAGTVAGAALGSMASTVATVIYQRSLDRTRDTLVARIRVPRGRGVDVADPSTAGVRVPAPRSPADAETVRLRVAPPVRPRRRWLPWLGATVLVFVLGLLVVTGVEWAKGSTITTGQEGTSVGRVLTDGPSDGAGEEVAPDPADDASSSAEPTAEPTDDPAAGSTAGSTAEPTPSGEPEPSGSAEPSDRNDADSGAAPEDGADGGTGGEEQGADPGVEATPLVPVPAAPQE
ncbi:hypothetical protein [Pseudonocardia nigra]|uniref:hypothetical protein n=1 Tax=Pseudonocardia nigra TaxID=1921578 RepID=UPI001C6005E0|nr:hypothetical protein [Pseudonocardia nigra]